jgi:PRC-barrel domain
MSVAAATAHPDHRCISSEDIHGTTVYGADDRNIGEIDHLIIDKFSGRVAYAVVSFGGFMGLGHSTRGPVKDRHHQTEVRFKSVRRPFESI